MKKIIVLVFGTLLVLLAVVLPLNEWTMARHGPVQYRAWAEFALTPPSSLREHLDKAAQREWMGKQSAMIPTELFAERLAATLEASGELVPATELERMALRSRLVRSVGVRGPREADDRLLLEVQWEDPHQAARVADRALAVLRDLIAVQYGPDSGAALSVQQPPEASPDPVRSRPAFLLWTFAVLGVGLGVAGVWLLVAGFRMDTMAGDAMG